MLLHFCSFVFCSTIREQGARHPLIPIILSFRRARPSILLPKDTNWLGWTHPATSTGAQILPPMRTATLCL